MQAKLELSIFKRLACLFTTGVIRTTIVVGKIETPSSI